MSGQQPRAGSAGRGSRPVEPCEDRQVADLLAHAFRDNPLNLAVVAGGPGRRVRSNRAGMQLSIAAARATGRAQMLCAEARPATLSGALIGLPPGAFPLPAAGLWRQLRCAIVQGPRVIARWAAIHEQLQPLRPAALHATLFILGVDPARQGRGIGSQLLTAWLESLDDAGHAAYLETDRERSAGLYTRFGFETIDRKLVLDIPITRMWRPPSRPSNSLSSAPGSLV